MEKYVNRKKIGLYFEFKIYINKANEESKVYERKK